MAIIPLRGTNQFAVILTSALFLQSYSSSFHARRCFFSIKRLHPSAVSTRGEEVFFRTGSGFSALFGVIEALSFLITFRTMGHNPPNRQSTPQPHTLSTNNFNKGDVFSN